MSHSIRYQFTELPTRVLVHACTDLKNSGNTLSVFLTIARNILQWEEGRKTLKKELSLRYIGEQLNMHWANVHKAVKKLVRRGYIKIVEIGTDGIGSIIELIIPSTEEETAVKEAVVKDTTPQDEPVVKDTTNKVVVKNTTNQITSSKKLTQEPTTTPTTQLPPPVVCPDRNKVEEKRSTQNDFSSIGSILISALPAPITSSHQSTPLIENIVKKLNSPAEMDTIQKVPEEVKRAQEMLEQKRQSSRQVCNSNDTGKAASTEVAIPGISAVIMNSGIRFLRDRGITEVDRALEEIKAEVENRKDVKYPPNYFLTLCKNKNNWNSIVKKDDKDNETREERKERWMRETKEVEEELRERNREIDEMTQYNALAEELKRVYPDKFKKASKEVEMELRKKRIFDCIPDFVKNQYAIEVFRVMYPDVAVN